MDVKDKAMAHDKAKSTLTTNAAGAAGTVARIKRGWAAFVSGENYPTDGPASAEQMAYAALLDIGMKIGLGAMVLCFLLYVSGLVQPHVPLHDLPRYWSMSVHDYVEATKVPTGWGWVHLIGSGDYLNILPVAFLSMITIVCYLRILPMLAAKRERIFSAIVVAEIVVLSLAVSGVLAGGH